MGKWLQAWVVAVWAILAPIHSAITVSFILIMTDLITGIMAAKKRGEAINSAGLRRTVTKLFIYEAALILAFITERYLLGDWFPIAKMVSGMIGLVELKSSFENLNTLSGQDLLKTVLEKINSANVDLKPKNKK